VGIKSDHYCWYTIRMGILDEGLKKGEMPAMEPIKNADG
jgi:hypothetical protein